MRCLSRRLPKRRKSVDVAALKEDRVLGSYRRAVGWTEENRHLRRLDRSYLLFGH